MVNEFNILLTYIEIWCGKNVPEATALLEDCYHTFEYYVESVS